jgi:acyl-CoA thioesterase-1
MQHIFPQGFRSCLSLLLLAIVAVACGGPDGAGSTPPERTESPESVGRPSAGEATRIVFLGDSLSAGYGLAEAQAFPALVEARLRERGHAVEVLNAGVSGDTSAGGLSRLDWVLRSKPQLLVVELGANDALRGQPLENTERNLREIVRRGREAGAQVMLLGMDVPTNYGPDYAEGFAELYPRITEEEDVQLVPGFIRDVGLDPALMMADGLHPTAEGHRILADRLTDEIESWLETQRKTT